MRSAAIGLSLLLLEGCATMGAVPDIQHAARRSHEYPVAIVPAAYSPVIDVPLRLRGKGEGALIGAGQGALNCLEGAARGSGGSDAAFAGLAALFCLTIGSLVGSVIGAVTAEPGETSASAQVRLDQYVSHFDPQRLLAETAGDYLREVNGAGAAVVRDAAGGPAARDDVPVYPSGALSGAGSLLELRVLALEFEGSGREGAPICLRIPVRARKIAAGTAEVLDDMQVTRTIGCLTVAQWLDRDNDPVTPWVADGYRRIVEDVVDEFYLVYQPPPPRGETPGPRSPIPPYVLAPLAPPPPEVYLDIDLFQSRRDRQGFGGMHFRDIDSLSPVFRWEAFPRAAETAAEGASAFGDVRYDWRLYKGSLGLAVLPAELVSEAKGLLEPQYAFTGELQPCAWYFWTVRARFRLHGAWRTTEWGGAYNTAGGHYSPSAGRRHYGSTFGFVWPARYLLYPFRMPASADDPGCWSD